MSPKITIAFNKFLDPIFIAYVKSFEKWKDYSIPSEDEVLSRVEAYKEAWNKVENEIMTNMQDVMKLSFVQNDIRVHIVSVNPRAFSNPIVIRSGFKPEEFIQVLTHELIHVLITDNKDTTAKNWTAWEAIQSKYKEHSKHIKTHVIVYAVIKEIENRTGIILDKVMEQTEVNVDYTLAKEIAENDLEFIIKSF